MTSSDQNSSDQNSPAPRPVPVQEHGPRPTVDASALGPARRRVLEAVAGAGADGTTIAALAARLGGHPNASRHHLNALVADGLLTGTGERPEGRGRPARVYRTTAAGRRALSDRAAVGYRELAAVLIAVAAPHPELMRAAGRQWGAEVARRVAPTGAETAEGALAGLLDDEGFAPAADGAGGFELRTCPWVAEARGHPAAVCGIHEAMLQGMLDASGSSDVATLEPFALPHACRLSLRSRR